MSAIQQIPEHYVTEFSTNWMHLVQQKQSRLKEYVTLDTVNGKEKTYNQINEIAMREITSRAGQTTEQDLPLAKRWIREKGYDSVNIFDEFDERLLGTIVLPSSQTVQAHAQAYKRTCDQVIIDALGGSAISGADGTTLTALPASQKVAIGGTGLTLGKIIAAKSLFGKNDVDEEEELIMVYTQAQLDDLLNNVNEVKSSDFNNVRALVDGTITKFMGFTWVRSQRLPKASTTRRIFAYAKSGLVLSDAGHKVMMDIRPDRNHALQVRSVARLGAVRLEEKKVVEISCLES
jgi:hypothetical protein